MHLVVDQVVQLEHVHVARRSSPRRTRSPVRPSNSWSGRPAAGPASPAGILRISASRRRRTPASPSARRSLQVLRRGAPTSASSVSESIRSSAPPAAWLLRPIRSRKLRTGRPTACASSMRRSSGPGPAPSRGGSRGPGRCSCARARPAGSARRRPACRPSQVRHVLDRERWSTTPLLPWRPAILSPGWTRRFTAR